MNAAATWCVTFEGFDHYYQTCVIAPDRDAALLAVKEHVQNEPVLVAPMEAYVVKLGLAMWLVTFDGVDHAYQACVDAEDEQAAVIAAREHMLSKGAVLNAMDQYMVYCKRTVPLGWTFAVHAFGDTREDEKVLTR